MKMIMCAAALAGTLLGSHAVAQTMPPAAPAQTTPGVTQVIPYSPNGRGDGHGRMQRDLTRAEAQQAADGLFQHDDINHDGIVTRDEAQQAITQALAARGGDADETSDRVERMLDRMFAGAPSVTQAQFEALALARFDRQDLNHDGVVTAAERRQGWANRGQ